MRRNFVFCTAHMCCDSGAVVMNGVSKCDHYMNCGEGSSFPCREFSLRTTKQTVVFPEANMSVGLEIKSLRYTGLNPVSSVVIHRNLKTIALFPTEPDLSIKSF
jgi:hypothetical protein